MDPLGLKCNDATPPQEGDRDYLVRDPSNLERSITDIDHIQDGVLWEEKSATNAGDVDRWVEKHVEGKMERYVEARPHLPGYEDAPIGMRFTEPGADPTFQAAVEQGMDRVRGRHPDVDFRTEWA
ncbi:hypothetical protein BJF85_24300 [Saccharomonospora sp. CUA-673]|uniref:hypothetical protein n=1 Tax=Saccharomonospora sp. CUA-673 TaxID=1904969 RepID=UPI00095B2CE8|nr:hypothetical protein [Saccharomonospora sp. CUA-673]OLT41248.1 hypothetical protein BJF85_24300 [Saccharomonospora sp. CUA-673]